MTKKIITILAVFLLVFLAGCTEKEETSVAGKSFVGGTQGLALTFLSGLPPAEVFDSDNPFQIGVKIENKGEYDIEDANGVVISITGINAADFGTSASDLVMNPEDALNGARIDSSGNVVAGDYTTVEFPEMNYHTIVSGSVPFTVRANACYEYGTKAQGRLCVRKDLRGVTGEAGVCNPDRVVPAENSGAPIQITNFKQNVAGSNKIDFFFTIKKVGAIGDSLHKSGSNCDSVSVANRDIVYVEVEDTDLGSLSCSGLKDGTATSGYVTLFNDEREVRCSQTIDDPDDFEKVVQINLEYEYKQYIDTQIKVKHASE